MKLGKIFSIVSVTALVAIVAVCGVLIFQNNGNGIINEVSTKEKAMKLLGEKDTSRSYITELENSTVNYTEDTSFVLSDENEFYYSQGFYLTDKATDDVIFSYSIDEEDFDDVENKNNEITETLSANDKADIDNIVSIVNENKNAENNKLYAIVGQLMIWSVTEDLNIEYLSDILTDVYINVSEEVDSSTKETVKAQKKKTSKEVKEEPIEEVSFDTVPTISTSKTNTVSKEKNTSNETEVKEDNSKGTETTIPDGDKDVTPEVKTRYATNNAVVCTSSCKESIVNIPLVDAPPAGSMNVTKTAVTESGSITEVKPGEKITYRITVENTGETTLSNIWLTDTPNNVSDYDLSTLSSITPLTGHIFIPSGLNTIIVYTPLSPGDSASFEFSINASSDASGTITNNISAAADDGVYAENENTLTVVEPVEVEELSVTKNATTESGSTTNVKPGEKINYEIVVENTGDVAIVNDLLISDTTINSSSSNFDMSTITDATATINGTPTGSAMNLANGVWFYSPSFNPGDVLVLKFSINASDTVTGELVNTVNVSGGSADATGDNTLIVDEVVEPVTDITINKTVTDTDEPLDGLASINETLRYTVSVTNNGDVANNVVIEDLMDDADLNAATAALIEVNDGTNVIDPSNYSVTSNTLTLNSIPAGATYNIVYTVEGNYKFDTSETIDNTASVISIDSVATTDITSTATINKQTDDISLTDLEFGKYVRDTEASRLDSYPKNDWIEQSDVKVAPLETIYWDLVISNPTDKVGTDIEIRDTAPDGFYNFLTITATKNGSPTWDGWSDSGVGSEERIITIDSIAPGDTWVFTIESQFGTDMYRDSYENYFQTTNTARLYDATDTEIGSASASIYLENLVDIQLFQINGDTIAPGTLNDQSLKGGDKVKFEVKVLNPTNTKMYEGDVQVEVPLPERLIKKGSCNIVDDGGGGLTNNSKCEGEGFIGIGGSAQDTVTFKPGNLSPGEDPEDDGDGRMSFTVKLADDITDQLFELEANLLWKDSEGGRTYTDKDFTTTTTYNAPNIDVNVDTPNTSLTEDEWVPFTVTVKNTGAIELAGSLSITDIQDNYISKYVRNVEVTPVTGVTAPSGYVEDYDPFSITVPEIFMTPGGWFTITYEQKADYSFNGKLDTTHNTVKACIDTTAGANYCELGFNKANLVTNPTRSINDAIVETNSIQTFGKNKKK